MDRWIDRMVPSENSVKLISLDRSRVKRLFALKVGGSMAPAIVKNTVLESCFMKMLNFFNTFPFVSGFTSLRLRYLT